MDEDYKRQLHEVITLYDLEPEIKDIYVEGITDKLVFDRFLKKYNITELCVKVVDNIDFTEIYDDYPDIKRNNKKKLVALSKIIYQKLGDSINGLSIIVDRDFDELNNCLEDNIYLLYSDYNNMEMYLYNEHVMDIFYKNILLNFPYNGSETLELIPPILIDIFLMKFVLSKNGTYPNELIPNLNRSLKIDKNGKDVVIFDLNKYLEKTLHNIHEYEKYDIWLENIHKYRNLLSPENRKNIRGHDFINVFFLLINKIKNNINLNEKTLERSLYQCLDYSLLRKEPLFLLLEEKYLAL